MSRSTVIRVLFVVSVAIYPILVYFGLQFLPPSFFAMALLLLLGLRFGVLLPAERPILVPILLVFVSYALIAALTGSRTMLLYYPVMVNLSLCVVFLNSLRGGESLLLRLLRSRGWPLSEYAPRYLYRLTIVWAGVFIINALVSAWTTTLSIEAWTLYNGLLSYIFIGLFCAAEYAFRLHYKRRMGVSSK